MVISSTTKTIWCLYDDGEVYTYNLNNNDRVLDNNSKRNKNNYNNNNNNIDTISFDNQDHSNMKDNDDEDGDDANKEQGWVKVNLSQLGEWLDQLFSIFHFHFH